MPVNNQGYCEDIRDSYSRKSNGNFEECRGFAHPGQQSFA